jgi:hypothetical protein
MMKLCKFTFLIFIQLLLNDSIAQLSYDLPNGYQLFKDIDGYTPRADGDFDNDGSSDVAVICENKKDAFDKLFVVFLSSSYLSNETYYYFPTNSTHFKLSFYSNTLQLDEDDDYEFYTYKFQYRNYLEDMLLVNYAHQYYMRNPTLLMGMNNVNLLDGMYSYNDGILQQFNAPEITLTNIDNYFEYLSTLGGSFDGNMLEEDALTSLEPYEQQQTEPEEHFKVFLNTTQAQLLNVILQHQPTLEDCKVVFKSDYAQEIYDEYAFGFNEIPKYIDKIYTRFQNKSACRAVEFKTNDVILKNCSSCPGRMYELASKINPNLTAYHIKFLENEYAEAGHSLSFYIYFNNRWVYFPVN